MTTVPPEQSRAEDETPIFSAPTSNKDQARRRDDDYRYRLPVSLAAGDDQNKAPRFTRGVGEGEQLSSRFLAPQKPASSGKRGLQERESFAARERARAKQASKQASKQPLHPFHAGPDLGDPDTSQDAMQVRVLALALALHFAPDWLTDGLDWTGLSRAKTTAPEG
ncbi:hypothetical protein MBM_04492 [Drepanopeziza brunnea f. sp. 'multigermtubi' MB_m1]|uniref:Uncharacterized protein n=1 Tax=Marssonina brunnea f. sp. multigermtubi (strain MB_m1) TaxID=1072389 RepID=K1WX65_MARBU|nr:uncharacterized protein MBM_04492 [Drepanopeziza brunnea f. sp. 'multigermtubi' MB_m1]EKD17631.1 hypothetical protein MBM_04492 [Drepanopeziza brunnea f. sp. 'multigermtubi' MB_m1]